MIEQGRQELIRPQEAARLLKVSKWTIYRWIKEGRLQATKISKGSLRIFISSVQQLIDEHKVYKSERDFQKG